jgi:ankyrin repeat protein
MKADLLQLCYTKKWAEMRKYLSSDAAEEEKKSNIMYCNDHGQTCLYIACCFEAPDDIIMAMIDIGGKESVMEVDIYDSTALHSSCSNGLSYNIIKMLIEVGGKDLVMAKSKRGYTALHRLCWYIKEHTKVAEIIMLILQVGDANLLLSAKNHDGKTPLEIATDKGASKRIKKLLTLQSNSNSTTNNDSPSANTVPADNSTPITQSSQEQDTTQSSSTNNEPNIPIRGLGIDQNHQSQLREAKQKVKAIQQDFDQKCIDYSDLEENFQSQLKEAKEQTMQIQQDYDQKCADCCHLKEENQVEKAEKLELGSALDIFKKKLYQCKKTKVDLENKVEAQGAEISLLAEQKEKGEKDKKYWKDKADNYLKVHSQQKAKLLEMEDAAGASVAGMQMMKQKEVEAAHDAKELEESNRKAAVEAQKVTIAALSSAKDKIKKLTQTCSQQKEELQLLKDSANGEGTKRKHSNEDGSVSISQSQSSKRSKVENTLNTSSVLALDTNQAEDGDDDATMIAGQLDQNNMLMSWYMAIKRRLRSANV